MFAYVKGRHAGVAAQGPQHAWERSSAARHVGTLISGAANGSNLLLAYRDGRAVMGFCAA